MKTSQKNIDGIFTFEGLWGVESRCGLRIRRKEGETVVLVTELYQDNPGTSVTQAATTLARQICGRCGVDPGKMIYIESNPVMDSKLGFYSEEYYRVEFGEGFSTPRWTKLDEEQTARYVEQDI